MTVRELIRKLLDYDLNSEILIHTNRVIQCRKITIESNEIKEIVPATGTGKYPKKYIIINCEFSDKCQ